MSIIDNFETKKVSQYLDFMGSGRVLIRFGHGWGDTLMFIPILERLRALYPQITIDLYLECGQEKIFKSVADKEGVGYDYVFSLNFPMAEGSDITKAEKCCLDELGIPYGGIFELARLTRYDSPFVAVHFQGTSLPNSVNCPPEVAREIWQEVIESGKIPIEVHFQHIFHNPINSKYDFINRDVRDIPAELDKLIGVIQNSFAFIGVASGCLMTALAVIPERTLYLEKDHKLETYTRKQIPKVVINNYQKGGIKIWLSNLGSN